MAELYQNSDQAITVKVFDSDGITPVDANTFQFATYEIFQTGTCIPLVTKTLGSGIQVSGTNFEVTLAAADITFNGINGEYTHAFRPGTASMPRLPPVFDTAVRIVEAC